MLTKKIERAIFFEALISIYESGYIPCGWAGKWPDDCVLYLTLVSQGLFFNLPGLLCVLDLNFTIQHLSVAKIKCIYSNL